MTKELVTASEDWLRAKRAKLIQDQRECDCPRDCAHIAAELKRVKFAQDYQRDGDMEFRQYQGEGNGDE